MTGKSIVFDRAVHIDSEDMEEFLSDPQGFLHKTNALDGLPDFKGFFDFKENKIESLRDYLAQNNQPITTSLTPIEIGGGRVVYHRGIPYEYYCRWFI